MHGSPGAEFGHDFAVDLDLSKNDEFFGFAAAGDTSVRDDFLQAF